MVHDRTMLRLLAIAVLVVSGLASIRGGIDAQTTGVVGNTYTSPTYGYSLSWSDSWVPNPDYELVNQDGVDRIRLGYVDTVAVVTIESGALLGTDLNSCVDEVMTRASNEEAFQDNVSPVDVAPLTPAPGAAGRMATYFAFRDVFGSMLSAARWGRAEQAFGSSSRRPSRHMLPSTLMRHRCFPR